MYKCKIIAKNCLQNDDTLEDKINKWLSENPGINIECVKEFSAGSPVYPIVYVMFVYKELKTKGYTYLKGETENA